MRRLTTVVRDVDWPGRTRRLAGWLNLVVAPPAARPWTPLGRR
jgi:hypothetical protein